MQTRAAAPVLGYAAVYLALGAISFATAYVAHNTAAVWIPTGFSLALLIARGTQLWPAIALGAFVLNLGDNLIFAGNVPVASEIAVAVGIAVGNTGEAVLGCYLAGRFAGGVDLLTKPIHVAVFAVLNATLPPLISMGFGVSASFLGDLMPASALPEAMLTWYLADAVGVLIVTAPLIALFDSVDGASQSVRIHGAARILEAMALIAGLVFASQAMSGMYIVPALRNWPRAYMVIPLLLWAVFRFRTRGVLIAILVVAAVSVAGTMRGFEAFPAVSHSRSLLYLQLFLGLLSVTTLAITAALTEIDALQHGLEAMVRDRTSEVDRLVRARDLFSTLVVHDLQNPLYGVRNALRAAAKALEAGTLTNADAAGAMKIMDETCSTLAAKITGLLGSNASGDALAHDAGLTKLTTMVERIISAQGSNGAGLERIVFRLEAIDLAVRRPAEVERILEGLIGNALKHGPPRAPVEVCAYRHGGNLEILVVDGGTGVPSSALPLLFRPEMHSYKRAKEQSGLGLFLASEQAIEIGGRLTYCAGAAQTTFRLIIPS